MSVSRLQETLDSGKFAVTAEIGPPRSCETERLREMARMLKGSAHAFNLTDNQAANVRMSSIASSVICLQEGLEPVMQMTCRDRNRIAMQSDVIGASALGVRNVLCISGDHQVFGNHPQAKNVYDIDSIQELMVLRNLCQGTNWSGETLPEPPQLYLGAAANPFADPFEFRAARLAKKADAGAQFVQTQCVLDLERFKKFMSLVVEKGLHERVHIIAGVIPLRSHKAALFMRNKVAGMSVPDELVDRLRKASDPKEEGIRSCVEMMNELLSVKGVHGVHITAIAWEDIIPRLVNEAGVRP
ncbi:MAG TPA: methylenetetrahydrofolate reductase [Methanomassiliicoccales archaeon]|nr:methylenetetrahydrofolate reductase [Methanomassiliicoccales archaeon]